MLAPLSKRLCHMFPVDHGIGVLDQTIDQHRDRQISPLLGRRQINPGIDLHTKPFPERIRCTSSLSHHTLLTYPTQLATLVRPNGNDTRRDTLRPAQRAIRASSNALRHHLRYSFISCVNASCSASIQDDRLIGRGSSSLGMT